MDDDYVRLSILCGYFAAMADLHLGLAGPQAFGHRIRQQAWTLTWDLLKYWQNEAIQRGLPQDALTVPQVILDRLNDPKFLAEARHRQQEADAANGLSSN